MGIVGEPSLLQAPYGASPWRLTSLAGSRDIVEASKNDGVFVISENQPTAPVRRSRMAAQKQRVFGARPHNDRQLGNDRDDIMCGLFRRIRGTWTRPSNTDVMKERFAPPA
jgi:hypothetical protein